MAEFKRKTLTLSTGKQLKLFGSSIAISKSLEVGEGYAPNILSAANSGVDSGSAAEAIVNPHNLTSDEIMELADYNIQLWMNLKANIRRHGLQDARIFTKDYIR